MTFLLVKYALLFLLAAVLGCLFGRWTVKRSFVDVTGSMTSDDARWDQLWRRLNNLRQPRDVDVTNITNRLDGLAYAICKLPEPTPPADLRPVHNGIAILRDDSQRANESAASSGVEVLAALHRIEESLRNAKVAANSALESVSSRQEAAITPPSPIKDDLKRIWGIGPKLEGLLNANGVFRFRQISRWTAKDIEAIDSRLDTFKGRIERDDWIRQAKKLCANSDNTECAATRQ